MSSTATPPAATRTELDPKKQFLDTYENEYARTMRVLRAFPNDKSELRPHPKAKNARELAFMFVVEQAAAAKGITNGFDWSKPPQFPPAPESLDAIIAAYEQGHAKMMDLVRGIPAETLVSETVQFPAGPGKMADMPKMAFLWMMLCDQIHHRGQLSVYLRMSDAKVPAIYGPSLDEPWM
jgi:uncharacterized damage-inducible protein DinB